MPKFSSEVLHDNQICHYATRAALQLLGLLQAQLCSLNVEYPVAVNHQLQGSLDYLLQHQQTLLVIEAKNEDLERGFLQLAIELIALDQWIE